MRRTKVSPISDPEKLRQFLKSRSMKATPQRLAVHEALSVLGHASADEVAEYISTRNERTVTVASIYNILNQFADLGICAARLSQGNRKTFDINTCPHIHMYDSASHKMTDIPDNGMLEAIGSLAKDRRIPGYKLDNVEIVLVCHPKRRKKSIL